MSLCLSVCRCLSLNKVEFIPYMCLSLYIPHHIKCSVSLSVSQMFCQSVSLSVYPIIVQYRSMSLSLYIPLNCNICPLYIPLNFIMSVPCTFQLIVMSVPCTFLYFVMSVPCAIQLIVMFVPCMYNFFDSLSHVYLKALNPFESSSKVWKSVSKYVSEQLTRTFAVLV